MKRELKKLNIDVSKIIKDIKIESDNAFENIAERNIQSEFEENALSFDKLSEYEKLELIKKEKRRLKTKTKKRATQVSLISVASFLLFGF